MDDWFRRNMQRLENQRLGDYLETIGTRPIYEVLQGLKESDDPYFLKLKSKLHHMNPDTDVADEFNDYVSKGERDGIFLTPEELALREKQNANRQEVMNMLRQGVANAMNDYKNRDDLRIKTVAKHKALGNQDIQLYGDLDAGKIDIARTKGLAFDDSEFEEEERI